MVKKKKFECNEGKALREAFAESIAKGKLFNINSWKIKREKARVRLKKEIKRRLKK